MKHTNCHRSRRVGATLGRDATRIVLFAGARLLCAGAVLVLCLAAPAGAAMLRVENWGNDTPASPPCGAVSKPCRSIGKALSLAVSGDTVAVGPGRYSTDLNGNSVYDEAGEEPSAGLVIGSGVTVKSTHGAAATRIEYIGPASFGGAVRGNANAVFGKRNHGFTLYVAPSTPILSDWIYLVSLNSGGSIAGNVIFAKSFSPFDQWIGAIGGVGTTLRDNRVASLAGVGLGVASQSLAERNVVIGAYYGFQGGGIFRHDVAIENHIGFELTNAVAEFTNNIAVANSSYGVELASSPSITVTGPFQKNTVVGNDTATNCGLYNASGSAVTATGNFWGPGGPGPDPADKACDHGTGSSTTTTPFLTAPVAPGPGAIQ